MTSKLEARELTFQYTAHQRPIFSNLSFQLPSNEFSLVVGESGSGKSTLFKCFAGLFPQYDGLISHGNVYLDDQVVSELAPNQRAKKVAMLFQNPDRQFAMKTPKEQLTFALENIRFPAAAIGDQVLQILKQLSLTHLQDQDLMTLSGGEQQRVALAAVLAMDSDIIILDEPFANVDAVGRQQLIADLKQLQQQKGKTILVSDHDLTGYDGVATRLFHLNEDQMSVEAWPLSTLSHLQPATAVKEKPSRNGDFVWQKVSVKIQARHLIDQTSFQLPEGQMGLLSGPNGSGKSTFFSTLIRQHGYTGSIRYQKLEAKQTKIRRWALIVGQAFQSSQDQFIRLRASEEWQLSAKMTSHRDYWTSSRLQAAVKALNLTKVADQVVYQLSGGQQKKLQVLSMLVMAPPVLLLDEPFAGLDQVSLQALLKLIATTTVDLKMSTLIISHQRLGVTNWMAYELTLQHQKLALVKGAL